VATVKKLGNRGEVASWKALESPGDIRRLLRWCVLSLRDRNMTTTEASCLGQLACHLLRAVEVADLEKRLAELESATQQRHYESERMVH